MDEVPLSMLCQILWIPVNKVSLSPVNSGMEKENPENWDKVDEIAGKPQTHGSGEIKRIPSFGPFRVEGAACPPVDRAVRNLAGYWFQRVRIRIAAFDV